MMRRDFVKTTVTAGVAAAALGAIPAAAQSTAAQGKSKFKLKYAPHFGMFQNSAGEDLVDQLKFAADQGFTAWEDNNMMARDVATQERVAKAMSDLGITMGVFVAHAEWRNPIYVRGGKETRDLLQEQMRRAVEVAQRVSAKWVTIVPGPYDRGLEWDYQTANVIDCLRAMCEICEPARLIMVLEPLNPWSDHAGLYLTKIPQAYLICEAVDSPSCKILNDLYHQQITEGNLIPNIDKAWKHIAYFQVGDNPGRREPTTGEINYRNVFRHIHRKGFTGVVGMEHGKSRGGVEGEEALLEAYRACDDFEV